MASWLDFIIARPDLFGLAGSPSPMQPAAPFADRFGQWDPTRSWTGRLPASQPAGMNLGPPAAEDELPPAAAPTQGAGVPPLAPPSLPQPPAGGGGFGGALNDNALTLLALGAGIAQGGIGQGLSSAVNAALLQKRFKGGGTASEREYERAKAEGFKGTFREWLDRNRATGTAGNAPSGWRFTDGGGLEPIPGGPFDPDYLASAAAAKEKPADSFDPEQKLRKEFEASTKPHTEVRQSYGRVRAAKDDAAGDIALVYGFMKMLDPGSVVREGEFATAQNAAGIPDQIRNQYNRALTGERLTPQQRDAFKGQAGAIYQRYDAEYQARANQFRDIARQYKLDPGRIIPDIGPGPGAASSKPDPWGIR